MRCLVGSSRAHTHHSYAMCAPGRSTRYLSVTRGPLLHNTSTISPKEISTQSRAQALHFPSWACCCGSQMSLRTHCARQPKRKRKNSYVLPASNGDSLGKRNNAAYSSSRAWASRCLVYTANCSINASATREAGVYAGRIPCCLDGKHYQQQPVHLITNAGWVTTGTMCPPLGRSIGCFAIAFSQALA